MQKAKKEELIRTVKFVLFSISAGVIEFVSFTLLTTLTDIIILSVQTEVLTIFRMPA